MDSGRTRSYLPRRTQPCHHRKRENTVMDDDSKTRTQLLDDVAALRQQLVALHTARIDTESVIETVREPLVVLTADLHVISANRAFYQMFQDEGLQSSDVAGDRQR